MVTTSIKEKDAIDVVNFTPLGKSIFTNREEVSIDSSNSLGPMPTVFNNPQEISIETGNDHALDIEVSPFMDSRQEVANVSSDLKDFISPIDSTHFRSFEKITLPLTEEKIQKGLKEPITSSFRWFAELAKSIFLRKTRTA